MTNFNYKKFLAESKATFFTKLHEGEAAYEYEKGKKAGEKMAKSELKEIYIAHLDKELDMSILSYMADVFISNAKDGDSKYNQFLDLNLRDAIFDVIDILNNKRHPLYMDALKEYNTVEADKIKGLFRENKSNKMTKSELKAKIKEMIVAEQEGDEEAEVEATDDVTTGDEEVTTNTTVAEVDPNIEAVQDALTQAQAAAQKLGDDKLMDQIGNTITFFTRTHVVEKPAGAVSEGEEIKETQNPSVLAMADTVVNALGAEKAFDELILAMDTNEAKDNLEHIIRMYDLDPSDMDFEMDESKDDSIKINEIEFPMLKKILK